MAEIQFVLNLIGPASSLSTLSEVNFIYPNWGGSKSYLQPFSQNHIKTIWLAALRVFPVKWSAARATSAGLHALAREKWFGETWHVGQRDERGHTHYYLNESSLYELLVSGKKAMIYLWEDHLSRCVRSRSRRSKVREGWRSRRSQKKKQEEEEKPNAKRNRFC